ncbi:GNAT family N-acetyltransferase [Luteimicrobium subarcticum]|uniref:Acetyltransferase (GNAT) family protein n=1 Tax=Luteimicrobium subarcticum TaxID=620910 RepID=A0A2M8WS91_9MICO|nr:GNAT family N-acetyltransferase [Luteimicrobium subarcticum]PJI93822.1 acetyltransferase (GNAT) family protein [Luteimicrobium subarcticum]
MSAPVLEVRSVPLDDPLVVVLLDELFHEYRTRYSDVLGELADDRHVAVFRREGADEFVAPDGDLVLLIEGGAPVAGGALRRRTEPELGDPDRRRPGSAHDADGRPLVRTAELKRIWTHSGHRRRGLGRRVLVELETRALALGYQRVYLTTGPRQPEAVGLYLAAGYTPLFDPAAVVADAVLGARPFEKWL